MKRDIINLIPSEYLPGPGCSGSLQGVCRNPDMYKAWRGFDNPTTARLLCPVNHLERMKGDPEGYVRWMSQPYCLDSDPRPMATVLSTQEGIKAATLPMKDRENQPFFPSFLYDEQMVDGSLTKGLFRGPLLLKASLSPSLSIMTADSTHRHTDTFSLAEAVQTG